MGKGAKGKKRNEVEREIEIVDPVVAAELEPEPVDPARESKRKPVTLRLNIDAIEYFKAEADRTGIPYQNIINAFLVQCMREERHLSLV